MTQAIQFLRENWLILSILAIVTVGYILLRTSPTDIPSVEAFDQRVRSDPPVVVVFYSNT